LERSRNNQVLKLTDTDKPSEWYLIAPTKKPLESRMSSAAECGTVCKGISSCSGFSYSPTIENWRSNCMVFTEGDVRGMDAGYSGAHMVHYAKKGFVPNYDEVQGYEVLTELKRFGPSVPLNNHPNTKFLRNAPGTALLSSESSAAKCGAICHGIISCSGFTYYANGTLHLNPTTDTGSNCKVFTQGNVRYMEDGDEVDGKGIHMVHYARSSDTKYRIKLKGSDLGLMYLWEPNNKQTYRFGTPRDSVLRHDVKIVDDRIEFLYDDGPSKPLKNRCLKTQQPNSSSPYLLLGSSDDQTCKMKITPRYDSHYTIEGRMTE
jgi:hypothetical protein